VKGVLGLVREKGRRGKGGGGKEREWVGKEGWTGEVRCCGGQRSNQNKREEDEKSI